jgi:short-subunit dehydrogenase
MTDKKNVFLYSTPLKPRKKAIIVGASGGIGAALAKRLAREGYNVACLARREAMLKVLCDEINAGDGEGRAIPYVHDVANYEAVPALLKQIMADLGGLDLVVYNAGIIFHDGPDSWNFERDRQVMEINTLGAMAWLDAVAPIFKQLKSGQIVGLGSVAGDRGRIGNPAYNTSKAALACYLEALRNRLTRHGVYVMTVKPGYVDTDMVKSIKKTFWVVSAEQAADDIWKGIRKHKQEIYISSRWRYLMLIIRHIPSIIFRRLSF